MSKSDFQLFVDSEFMSPYAMSVFVTLHEKGIPVDLQCVDLGAGENLGAAYRARSLTWRVPTLIHGNLSLAESSAITEYLEELFPPPTYAAVYPQDPATRAKAREVQAWLRSDLLPIRAERPTEVIYREPLAKLLSEDAQRAAEKLFQAAATLLAPGALSLFGEWCIADTDLALMLNRLLANGDEVPEQLANYVRHQWNRPSVQAWLAQGEGAVKS